MRKNLELAPDREWTRFTPRAQRALEFAIEEARAMKLEFVGVEHLLVGLLRLGNGVAVNVLRKEGLTLEVARAEMLKLFGGTAAEESPAYLATTPRLNKVLGTAKEEAIALGHTYVGTEHLLLGILAESQSVAHEVLTRVNIDPAAMRKEILRELAPSQISPESSEKRRDQNAN